MVESEARSLTITKAVSFLGGVPKAAQRSASISDDGGDLEEAMWRRSVGCSISMASSGWRMT
jgi:hypothetical protein